MCCKWNAEWDVGEILRCRQLQFSKLIVNIAHVSVWLSGFITDTRINILGACDEVAQCGANTIKPVGLYVQACMWSSLYVCKPARVKPCGFNNLRHLNYYSIGGKYPHDDCRIVLWNDWTGINNSGRTVVTGSTFVHHYSTWRPRTEVTCYPSEVSKYSG